MPTGPDLLYANSLSGSSVDASATTVQLAPYNPNRNSLWIFNHSTVGLYVKVGASASLTDFSFRMESGSFLQIAPPCPIHEITGIWDAAVGSAKITIIE